MRDHLDFLCDVSELGAAVAASPDCASSLQQLVQVVARHLEADVCSIYLYDETSSVLTLRANVGLTTREGCSIRLQSGEGLVGSTFADRSPILDNHASSNPRYKLFPGIDEERYDSFLAVPLVKGSDRIGVLAVQREERDHFSGDDLTALKVVACQLVGCIDDARIMTSIESSRQDKTDTTVPSLIRGKVVSEGTAIGPSRVVRAPLPIEKLLASLSTTITIEEFNEAYSRTIEQIEQLQLLVAEKLPEAISLIFSAHLMILKDKFFVGAIRDKISSGETVVAAITDVINSYRLAFLASESALFREKANDLDDLGVRLARNLLNCGQSTTSSKKHQVVIATSIFPSDLVMVSLEDPAGLILVEGAATSHVSILARSLGLPLFITNARAMLDVPDGTQLVLDGFTGNIYVAPNDAAVHEFASQVNPFRASIESYRVPRGRVTTGDGVEVKVRANINLLSEIPTAQAVQVDGIGLYRTEFPFMIRNSFPDEEEQFLVYRQLVHAFADQTVTFRTLDVGGDKTLSYLTNSEENPELGLRGIRFSLRHKAVFAQQVRAILRAGVDCAGLRIMFPMVSSIDQFRTAVEWTHACVRELEREGTPVHASPKIGLMLEVPSILETVDELCAEADFFSIGSNDFVQYMLAADRGNEEVAEFHRPHHPAVLRALAKMVRIANHRNVPVSICGEMANQSVYLPFLLGIGLREFSVAPNNRDEISDWIRKIDLAHAIECAEMLLWEPTLRGVESLLDQYRVHDALAYR